MFQLPTSVSWTNAAKQNQQEHFSVQPVDGGVKHPQGLWENRLDRSFEIMEEGSGCSCS